MWRGPRVCGPRTENAGGWSIRSETLFPQRLNAKRRGLSLSASSANWRVLRFGVFEVRAVHNVVNYPRVAQLHPAAQRFEAFQLQLEAWITLEVQHDPLRPLLLWKRLGVLFYCLRGGSRLLSELLPVPHSVVTRRNVEFAR